MGRVSTKENKTQYQVFREELGYSREKASELLGWISAERIEKIENEKSIPYPDEVLAMSVAYKKPRLCNNVNGKFPRCLQTPAHCAILKQAFPKRTIL